MAEDAHVHDIIIVGAGPCGLAVAARLHEHTPSALFTDTEHNRFYRRYPGKPTLDHCTGRYSKGACPCPKHSPRQSKSPYDMLVLDATSDHWMGTWNRNFEALQISHLRSPLFFHPDPRDRDGLLAFAYSEGKMRDLEELTGVVGKELSKHKKKMKAKSGRKQADVVLDERDRHDYFTPSRPLFENYCTHIISRYSIGDIVVQAKLESLTYGYVDSLSHLTDDKVFTLKTSTGTKHARIVVLAIGAPHLPVLPADSPLNAFHKGSACHSSHISTCGLLPSQVKAKIKEKRRTNVVVVGGGLTSAQIADACVKAGVSKVWHVMRSEVKVKHFDVDLGWVAKFRNTLLSTFWMADNDDERLEMVKRARNGGSITPKFRQILATHEFHGRLTIHPFTKIVDAVWDADASTWSLGMSPALDLPPIDHVIYATGAQPDIATMPMLADLMAEHPVDVKGGMPCLTNDLMWNDDVPCLMTGRLAALRLGPGAGNLEGARLGAERIAWKVEELLQFGSGNVECFDDGEDGEDGKVDWGDEQRCFTSGAGNSFGILGDMEWLL